MFKRSLILIFCLCVLLLSACSMGGNASTEQPASTPVTLTGSTPATFAQGSFREYPLPQKSNDLMRPVVDRSGRVWVGDMQHNALLVFDPQTSQFRSLPPPKGAHGIMGVVAAPDNTIWFSEQYANYIGHYLPATDEFRIYPLPTLAIPDPTDSKRTQPLPVAPNDITLDAQGNIWFTEMNADSLGMLNVKTGRFTHYPITIKRSIQQLNPYGLAVDAHGIIWFSEASSNDLGRLDPKTGTIRHFKLSGTNTPLMEVEVDAQGLIWATSFNAGLLVRFDPQSKAFTRFYAPHSGDNSGGLYGLTITKNNQIWLTVTAENIIARLDPEAQRFFYYQIPTSGAMPLGIATTANNVFWFTQAGNSSIGELQP